MTRAWPATNGIMTVGGIPVDQLAETHDTPCFITDGQRIRECYRSLLNAFGGSDHVTIAYACKANTTLAILKLLECEGSAVDVVSPGEAHIALQAGFSPERIHFTGTNPRNNELGWLLEHEIAINIDSLSMARRIAPMAKNISFGVRVNPGIGVGHHAHVVTGSEDTKFGLHADALPKLCRILEEQGHTLTRLHAHIGSGGIMDPEPFVTLIDTMHRMARQIADQPAVKIDAIDLGGGFGVPYRPSDNAMPLETLADTIGNHFRECFGSETALIIEPGRYLVADSTILLSRINTIKETPHVTFAGIDAGMHTLLRPALYDSYHHIEAATKMDATPTHHYTVCGPICETADVLGRQRNMPELAEGDLLAICDAGAYGAVMSSTYNSRPRAAEVLVLDGKDYCIRDAETFEDLLKGQCIPPPLD